MGKVLAVHAAALYSIPGIPQAHPGVTPEHHPPENNPYATSIKLETLSPLHFLTSQSNILIV